MISNRIGQGARVILRGIIATLIFFRIKPNHLTFLGFLVSIVVAYYYAMGQFVFGGITLIVAGLFDMTDGLVARKLDAATQFGAFFDSIMDRYSDLIMYLGLVIYYGRHDRINYVVLVGICMMGSVLTSYARARAECFIEKCKVGFLERPERIVLLLIGSFYFMDPVLWVIAFFSNLTVVHRILYTRAEISGKNSIVKL